MTSLANKIIFTLLFFFILANPQSSKASSNPDFLWNTVSKECVPNQKTNGTPAPCDEVFFEKDGVAGHVVFKDSKGPLQYLLLPITKITGIESPLILADDTPNYFYQAWEAKTHMENIYKSSIPAEEISLAVNSQLGRSQNQLHIHISCIRTDVKDLVHKNLQLIGESWGPFPGGILGHNYFARHITLDQLKNKNAFKLLSELSLTKNNMNEFGLALVAIKNIDESISFILLTDRAAILKLDRGTVEEIQDHDCPQLYNR
jgi:CDP-diacylglycerol pyrophosphatase